MWMPHRDVASHVCVRSAKMQRLRHVLWKGPMCIKAHQFALKWDAQEFTSTQRFSEACRTPNKLIRYFKQSASVSLTPSGLNRQHRNNNGWSMITFKIIIESSCNQCNLESKFCTRWFRLNFYLLRDLGNCNSMGQHSKAMKVEDWLRHWLEHAWACEPSIEVENGLH